MLRFEPLCHVRCRWPVTCFVLGDNYLDDEVAVALRRVLMQVED